MSSCFLRADEVGDRGLEHANGAFGFDYEFASATDCYRSGRFDDMLQRVLERFDAVMEIMLPSLVFRPANTLGQSFKLPED